MDTFFLLCAIVGGTILLLQFAMTVFGIGGHEHDLSGNGGVDVGGHDFSGDFSASHGHHGSGHDSAAGSEHAPHHGTVWFFKVITFQTLVAALAFFGIAGRAAREADIQPLTAFLIAVAAGLAAMYGVYYLIRGLHKFNADGTLQIARAVGLIGTVYIPIPAGSAGAGKIQMNLQNRVVELQAMTNLAERLPSGAKVRVVGILGPDTVEVQRLVESETPSHV